MGKPPSPERPQTVLAPTLRKIPSQTHFPIHLTPRNPYLLGVAALVFAHPHVLSPADDIADFGAESYPLEGTDQWVPEELPHPGACAAAWFRDQEAGNKFYVEFGCEGSGLYTLTTYSSSETVQLGSGPGLISTTLLSDPAAKLGWQQVVVSCDNVPWHFRHFELGLLPED